MARYVNVCLYISLQVLACYKLYYDTLLCTMIIYNSVLDEDMNEPTHPTDGTDDG